MEREKKLSILYQKQGRATQFSSKAARDKWLQKEIDDLERVHSSNKGQASIYLSMWAIMNFVLNTLLILISVNFKFDNKISFLLICLYMPILIFFCLTYWVHMSIWENNYLLLPTSLDSFW